MKCCICGTLKNVASHLKNVLKNVKQLISLFDDYVIILYYDNSTDGTKELLLKYKKKYKIDLYCNTKYHSPWRTHRLAHGRNTCLKRIRQMYSDYEYFIMMDWDDVCATKMDISVIERSLQREDWDALSFNRAHYYDIWALSLRPYVASFIHFEHPYDVLHAMTRHVEEKLKALSPGKLLECGSAFNGFVIYRTSIFIDCQYDGHLCIHLLPEEYVRENIEINRSSFVFQEKDWLNIREEDCEHRAFHWMAIHKHGARIRISPEKLF